MVVNFQRSVGLPDVHSGYGFAIGNVAAFDMSDPNAIVSPGIIKNNYFAPQYASQMNVCIYYHNKVEWDSISIVAYGY